MSQRERDRLRVLHSVLDGQRTQVEAAHLMRLTTRQVRRLLERLRQGDIAALVHGPRGRPSNRRKAPKLRQRAVHLFRRHYHGFGPTFAAEKLAERGLEVSPDTPRRWLLAEGLWQPQRHRLQHRSRRPRRACFGELVQMDRSIHDWTEGRGEDVVLMHMIDDATSQLLAHFYGRRHHPQPHGPLAALAAGLRPPAGAVHRPAQHLRGPGQGPSRPRRVDATRPGPARVGHRADHGQEPPGQGPRGALLRHAGGRGAGAGHPDAQAKGRVGRSFGTAQNRLVKEMRLAGACTIAQANALLDGGLLAKHNRLFSVPARDARDAHRVLGRAFNADFRGAKRYDNSGLTEGNYG